MSDKEILQEDATVLRQIREALGMKQTDFAYFLKVTPATISSCECGKREMVLTFEQWRKLAALVKFRLGVDLLDYKEEIILSKKMPFPFL